MSGSLFRILLAVSFAFPVLCAARDASAIGPELYAGLGVRTLDLPGGDRTDYSGTLEAGIDNIIADIGAGLRIDTPRWKPAVALQLRYTLLSLPLVRLLAGAGAGVERSPNGSGGNSYSWNGTYEVFAGARFSMGLPYLGLNIGGAKSNFGSEGFQLFSTLTVGLAF